MIHPSGRRVCSASSTLLCCPFSSPTCEPSSSASHHVRFLPGGLSPPRPEGCYCRRRRPVAGHSRRRGESPEIGFLKIGTRCSKRVDTRRAEMGCSVGKLRWRRPKRKIASWKVLFRFGGIKAVLDRREPERTPIVLLPQADLEALHGHITELFWESSSS